jgi:hypothetical protein
MKGDAPAHLAFPQKYIYNDVSKHQGSVTVWRFNPAI